MCGLSYFGQCRYRTFPSFQIMLLDGTFWVPTAPLPTLTLRGCGTTNEECLTDVDCKYEAIPHGLSWEHHSGLSGAFRVPAQSCPTLCDPLDCSLPGSSVHGIFRQDYWSGLPFPPSGDLLDPGIVLKSLASPALVGGFFTTGPSGKSHNDMPGYLVLVSLVSDHFP